MHGEAWLERTYIHTYIQPRETEWITRQFFVIKGGDGFVGYYGEKTKHIKSKPALKHGKEKRAKKVEKVGLVWLVVG